MNRDQKLTTSSKPEIQECLGTMREIITSSDHIHINSLTDLDKLLDLCCIFEEEIYRLCRLTNHSVDDIWWFDFLDIFFSILETQQRTQTLENLLDHLKTL